jgi:hypothetical protein
MSVNTFYKIYLSVLFIGFVLAVLSYRKGFKNSIYIMLLLMATFLIEVFSLFNIDGYSFNYYIFNLFEYTFFCIYYLKTVKSDKLKSVVKVSIPIFIIFGICSGIVYHFRSLPALNIDVEGFLLFIIYTHLLFNIDADINKNIYQHPDFWISIGVLIFFSGSFVCLGIYPTLLHINLDDAFDTYNVVTQPLNLILYNCIIISFICLLWPKKYYITL